jgi:hypothetical protein
MFPASSSKVLGEWGAKACDCSVALVGGWYTSHVLQVSEHGGPKADYSSELTGGRGTASLGSGFGCDSDDDDGPLMLDRGLEWAAPSARGADSAHRQRQVPCNLAVQMAL